MQDGDLTFIMEEGGIQDFVCDHIYFLATSHRTQCPLNTTGLQIEGWLLLKIHMILYIRAPSTLNVSHLDPAWQKSNGFSAVPDMSLLSLRFRTLLYIKYIHTRR